LFFPSSERSQEFVILFFIKADLFASAQPVQANETTSTKSNRYFSIFTFLMIVPDILIQH